MRTTIIAAAIIAGGLAVAGCGAASTSSPGPSTVPASTAPAAQPANPVPIVRLTGAKVKAGEVYGLRDMEGDLYADGDLYGPGCTAADNCSEQVTVYTMRPGVTPQQDMAQSGLVPSDSEAVIVGPDWIIEVTPVDELTGGGGYTYFVSPQVIAARVHGTALTPPS